MSKSKYWVFTKNNPTPQDEERISEYITANCEYGVFQVEAGESGTVHLQGYVCFATRKGLSGVAKGLLKSHVEARRGSHEEAKDYCCKEETRVRGPFEFGDDSTIPRKPGERSDLSSVRDALCSGASLADIADSHFGTFVKYHSGLRAYIALRGPSRDFKSRVEVHWGIPGSGKSHYCREKCNDAGVGNWYWMSRPADGQAAWWCGINPHAKVIIIDDFYGWLPYSFMLQLCDQYPFRVQVKGSSVSIAPELIVITSNAHPRDWYPKVSIDRMEALMRRIELVQEYTRKYEG